MDGIGFLTWFRKKNLVVSSYSTLLYEFYVRGSFSRSITSVLNLRHVTKELSPDFEFLNLSGVLAPQ